MRVNWDNVKIHSEKILDGVIEDMRNRAGKPTTATKKAIDLAAREQPESNRKALESLIATQVTAIMLRSIALFLETSSQRYVREPNQDN